MSFHILVVDDTKFMRKMLTDILKQYGHVVVGEAENGRQAVQKYEELRPDIVLMDITMPEMDGIEAMKEIRRINASAVVLICSAMSQQDLISDALKAGANGYVMKPFKPNRVNEIVRKYGVPRVIEHLLPQEHLRAAPAEEETSAAVLELAESEGFEADALGRSLVQESELEQEPEEPTLTVTESDEESVVYVADEVESARLSETVEAVTNDVADAVEEEDAQDRLLDMMRIAAVMQGEEEEESAPPQDESVYDEEMEFSLEELDDLTFELAQLDSVNDEKALTIEVPVEEVPLAPLEPLTSAPAKTMENIDYVRGGLKSVNGGKIINLFRGNEPMKNFTSSYMCNWNEEMNGDMTRYLVICTEAENKLELEMTGSNGEKQLVTLTVDSFNQLASWLQVQLGTAPVNVREYAKKADYQA